MIAWLIETLVATTALMLLVLVIREPVRHLFGSHVAYALWLLPALRMILPPFASLLPQSVQETAVVQSSGAVTELVRVQLAELAPAAAAAPMPEAAVSTAANWPIIMAGLWLGGLMLFALNQWLAYRRFCGFILSEATPREQLAPGILLVTSPRAKGPMAFGLRRRFIVLPENADRRFDEEERAMALAHELAHHTRGDLFANAAALVLLTLHWCNPVAWFAYRAFRNDQEMACDADVIDAVRGSALGHAYGRALVKSASGLEFAAVCNLTTVDRLKRRLKMLSNESLSNRRRKAGFLMAGSVVIGGLVLTASGESMAAQVGARVSDALPVASIDAAAVKSALASLPGVADMPVLHATQRDAARAEKAAAQAEMDAARAERLAIAAGAEPVPPTPPTPLTPLTPRTPVTPPTPPAPGAAPTPPVPPVPPVRGVGNAHRVVTMTVDEKGRKTRRVIVNGEEVGTIVLGDVPEVRSGHCGSTSEASRRNLIETKAGDPTVMIVCEDRIEAFAKDAERMAIASKDIAMRSREAGLRGAMSGLQAARATIQANGALSASEKARALAGIDEAMSELRASRADD